MRIKPSKVHKPEFKKGYCPPFEMNRMKWTFHSYDADPFPSVPHGHSVNSSHKLQVHTGDIYKGKVVCGKITKKEYKRLWDDPNFIKYVKIAEQHYENEKKNTIRRARVRHKWRIPSRARPLFTVTTEVEIFDPE
ncbi:hypothetical protein M3226_30655 [Neobacillus cucumis]|uniref:hypothetical protein n=1 Tax=Neobacillus cucumis TaxID=1740721 RepID=UPI0020411F37|nr:hypothetical protein [Neobacillus cucumis]MCM3729887.1 hypothetical protein [Neobacillus cucumis]